MAGGYAMVGWPALLSRLKTRPNAARLPRVVTLHVALFLSGAAALAYETTWSRMLEQVFGVSDHAVASVLAAFFLGMGGGAYLGGRLGTHARDPGRLYAWLELGVALWGMLSLALIPSIADAQKLFDPSASWAVRSTLSFAFGVVLLLPPTLLMGATLPVVVAAVAGEKEHWSATSAPLYGTNTLGATLGAALTGLFLLPEFGSRTTVVFAAAASAMAALLVRFLLSPSSKEPPSLERGQSLAWTSRSALAAGLALLAGFSALASEVLWTRALRLVIQGTTQAFAAMLACYLFGIGLGGYVASLALRRGLDALRVFALTQTILALLTAWTINLASELPRIVILLNGRPQTVPHDPWVIVATTALLLLPLALLLGMTVPLAWRIAANEGASASRDAGRILAANTIGGFIGAVVGGFVLVPWLGLNTALQTVLAAHLLCGLWASLSLRLKRRALWLHAAFALSPAILLYRGPSIDLPFLLDAWYEPSRAAIEGGGPRWRKDLIFLREGRNTTVSIVRRDDALRLYNDGRPESGYALTPPAFGVEIAYLGGLPTLLAERRDRAAIVGLGAGHVASVMLKGPWRHVEVIEIEEVITEAARKLHELHDVDFPLDDPRAELILDDGRSRLNRAPPATYDAIVSQPSHPWLANASSLYSAEFLEQTRRSLRRGGVVALWVNLFRMDTASLRAVVATVRSVFDHVLVFVPESSSVLLVAGQEPLELGERLSRRLEGEPGLRSIARDFGVHSPEELLARLELDTNGVGLFTGETAPLHDDRPVLEYTLARLPHEQELALGELDRALGGIAWLADTTYDALPKPLRLATLAARLHYAANRSDALDRVIESTRALDLGAPERSYLAGIAAELKGDIRAALAFYDRSPLGAASLAADRLRYEEGLFGDLLNVAFRRSTAPEQATPLLLAALERGQPEDLGRSLAQAEAIDHRGDRHLTRFARAWLERGCELVLPPESLAGLAGEYEIVATHAEHCLMDAAARGNTEAGERAATFSELRAHRRLERSMAAIAEGREKRRFNPGGAERAFRLALRLHPGLEGAAADLARLLDAAGRRSEAVQVLRDANTRILPQGGAQLRMTAQELGIELR